MVENVQHIRKLCSLFTVILRRVKTKKLFSILRYEGCTCFFVEIKCYRTLLFTNIYRSLYYMISDKIYRGDVISLRIRKQKVDKEDPTRT